MILWLLRKCGILPTPGAGLYRPAERKLYGYWNGHKTIWEDPLVLYKKLMEVGPELSVDIKVANSSMKGNIEASNNMVEKIRTIFDIEPYDKNNPRSSGLTQIQLADLLGHFMSYCEDIKKNSVGSPTSPPTSEPSAPSSIASEEKDQPTKSALDSTSTEKESSTEKPTPSPSASGLPSDLSSQDLIILGPSQTARAKPN